MEFKTKTFKEPDVPESEMKSVSKRLVSAWVEENPGISIFDVQIGHKDGTLAIAVLYKEETSSQK